MSRLDYPILWAIGNRELELNGHRTEDGGFDRSRLDHTYQVESYDFSPLDIREQREGRHLLTGGDFGPATRQFRHISLRGVIKARNGAELDDMEAEFLAAFDIEHAQRDVPTTFGVGTLKHSSETAFSGPGIGQLVSEGFYCRPEGYPVTYDRRGPQGIVRAFMVQLASAYPYRVLFPAESVVFSAAAGWSHDLHNWNQYVGGESQLQFDLTMTGAGANDFTVTDGTRSLVLDLSGASSGWNIRIEMWTKQIYRPNGTTLAYVRTSDIDSFFDVPAGGAAVSISNRTNVSSVTATYHQTRA
jgi:hypothetical protein